MTATPMKLLPKGKGESLLIVDDEMHLRMLLSEMLELHGYQVACASDGTEALTLYKQSMDRQCPFDLVILDLMMPRMGGRECLERLLEMNPYIKFILSTGLVESEMDDRGVPAHAGRVLRKPFLFRELVEKVSLLLAEA
ncbi:MAG: response regulator [Syntrophobacteraceae bacterium]